MPLSRPRQKRRLSFAVRDGEMRILDRRLFGGNQSELLERIDELVESGVPALVVTLNVDQTLNLQVDEEFAQAVQGSSLLVIDGTPVSWLGRMLGAHQAERNTGADLMPAVSESAPSRGWGVVVTGGSPEAAEAAALKLASSHGSNVSSIAFPFIDGPADVASETVIATLWDSKPAVVFLCLGSPKQELWFDAWKHKLPPAVYVGAGAAVDFASGQVRRAPAGLQRAGLEWAYRLCQEPRRLAHRYLVKGPHFLGIVGRSIVFQIKANRGRRS